MTACPRYILPLAAVVLASAVSGCQAFRSANSPDVVYSEKATASRALQVPPDLTDVSDGEQFVLPGVSGSAVTRNTLLPSFDAVSYQREGGESWLAFQQAPEDLWPQLLSFLRSEKYSVAQTSPVSGLISTDWRDRAAVSQGGLLKNLIGGDAAFTRVAFRLERDGAGARLFARQQAGNEAVAAAGVTPDWPPESHNPEATSALLQRLLAWLGVREQVREGLLDSASASQLLDAATLSTTAGGTRLLIHRGYSSSLKAVQTALATLGQPVTNVDDGLGRIDFSRETQLLVLELEPVHVSEVEVTLKSIEGQSLDADSERQVLEALRQLLA